MYYFIGLNRTLEFLLSGVIAMAAKKQTIEVKIVVHSVSAENDRVIVTGTDNLSVSLVNSDAGKVVVNSTIAFTIALANEEAFRQGTTVPAEIAKKKGGSGEVVNKSDQK